MNIKYIKSNNWMAKIPGDRLITHINMSGAHDCGTCYISAAIQRIAGSVKKLQIDEQLNAGVRFLDCRLGYLNSLRFFSWRLER